MNVILTKTTGVYLLALLGILLASAQAGPAPQREALAERAEKEGKFGMAFQHYLALFQSADGKPEEEARLRRKLIVMANKLEVPPQVPQPARVRLQRGLDAIDDFPRESDYRNAINEFKQASQLAPWWADPYFEMASVQETLGEYRAAVVSVRYCIAADSGSRRARKLQSKLVDLLDKDDRTPAEKSAEAKRRQAEGKEREREFFQSLKGTWAQISKGPVCLWKLHSHGGANFELTPYLLRGPNDTDRALSRDERGYFVGEIVGDKISGYAMSAKPQKAQATRETVKLSGTFLPNERVLVLRYTFFFDPADGTLLTSPWETEVRFQKVTEDAVPYSLISGNSRDVSK